jgi:hypothetical protein
MRLCTARQTMVVLAMMCATACTLRVGDEVGRVDERGAAKWLIEQKPYSIDKTYFQIRGQKDAAFVVEWTCADCRRHAEVSQDEALALVRPVLWHAIELGEDRRIVVRGASGPLKVSSIVGVTSYEIDGKRQQISTTITQLDALFDWTWPIAGRAYHVYKPGYYFDVKTNRTISPSNGTLASTASSIRRQAGLGRLRPSNTCLR